MMVAQISENTEKHQVYTLGKLAYTLYNSLRLFKKMHSNYL